MSTVSELPAADWELWRTMRSMNEYLSRELDRQLQRDAGISQADYRILLALYEAPGHRLRTGELGDLVAWEKSRVSHQVARMEARGLVERLVCDSDGRGTWVSVTTEGTRSFLGAVRQHAATIRELFFDELTDDEKAIMLAATSRVVAKLDAVCQSVAAHEAGAA
jgi:DNA-binding MarR family transcriptional regulator